jgi:tetratricopeptide (TPR) repeat protein
MKNYSECINLSLETIKKFPRNADVLWYLADCYCAKNMHNEAIQYYKKVIELNPDGDRFYSLIAYEYFILQDFVNSEMYSKKALDLNKNNKTAASILNEVEKRKLPESRQISEFIAENYLYIDKVRDFEKKSRAFTSKKDVGIQDITSFVNSVKEKNDNFTFVVSGKDYDTMAGMEKSNQPVFKEMDKNVVYVGINSFTSNTGWQFKEIIDKIKNPQEKYMVIDLKDNGGGLVNRSNDILDLLLPVCTTGYLIYRDGYIDSYNSDENYSKFKGIYIFTNQNSASSAEFLSMGLKKFLPNVTVVGRPTSGKGVGQKVYENKAKKYMIYLVSFYWNVKEKNIQAEKIKPDIKVWRKNNDAFLNAVYKDISKK